MPKQTMSELSKEVKASFAMGWVAVFGFLPMFFAKQKIGSLQNDAAVLAADGALLTKDAQKAFGVFSRNVVGR